MPSAKSRAPQSTVSFCRTLILPLALLTFMAAALFSVARRERADGNVGAHEGFDKVSGGN